MRIAIVTHNVIKGDGQGRANYEIARAATKQGIEVTLYADRVAPELEGQGIRWVRVQPRIRSNWLMHGLEFVQKVRPLLLRDGKSFDIVHGYGYTLDVPHHVNTSQYVHSAWRKSSMHPWRTNRNAYGLYQWLYSRVNAAGEKIAYKQAKVVVAASHTVRQELLDIGVPENRLRVILNGADPAEFHPGSANRTALGLPESAILGLFAGDIRTGRKNLDTVLKAMIHVPEMHLAVVGTKAGSPFPAMAEYLGLSPRVHFLDFRRDIADIMRACDFFVFPSRYEACALVLVESIASGLPVVTAETTGGAEVVSDQVGIRIPNPDDADALAVALRQMTQNPEARERMSAAAHQASANYTWDKITSAYLDLYREVAAGKSYVTDAEAKKPVTSATT